MPQEPRFQPALGTLLSAAEEIILGKRHTLKLALTAVLARGHLLIEDIPGVGKTTLAHTLARLLGLRFQRIQFTSDLLPADVLGMSIFDRESGSFRFHPGPVFAQLILADEINRATPKTQSALLEVLEEEQVTTEGTTHYLPDPFFVIATQNPITQIGTFPLPESQLDRFLLRVSIGYPDQIAERALLLGEDRRSMLERHPPVIDAETLKGAQIAAGRVHVSDRLADYLQALIRATRDDPEILIGLSPRAGLGLLSAAKAWALLEGREMVLPEDVQAVFPNVAAHRLIARDGTRHSGSALAQRVLTEVAIC